MNSILAVRGAVSIETGEQEISSMRESVPALVSKLSERNGFESKDVVSIHLTQTSDLTAMNAAAALRQGLPEYNSVPLMCSSEPDVQGGMKGVVRILVTWRGEGDVHPVYMGKTASLRPDLAGE